MKTSNNDLYSYIFPILSTFNKNIFILNFGSGDGFMSKQLFDSGYKNITNCDIADLSIDKTFPVNLYDGEKLPFRSNSFDIVMMNFVLHHIDYNKHIQIINELKRVTKKFIIISEDMTDSFIDKILGGIHLKITNGWNSSNNAYFRTSDELYNIYKKLNVTIVKKVDIPRYFSIIYPIERSIFVLQKGW